MRKTLLVAALILIGVAAQAQTEKELIGKWKLIRMAKGTEEIPVEEMFGTDEVYQVFSAEGKKFAAIIDGKEVVKGTFRMSDDNKKIIIKSSYKRGKEEETTYDIQSFDASKRTVTNEIKGAGVFTLGYEKVEE